MPHQTDGSAQIAFGGFTIDRADERLRGPHGPVKLGNKAYRVILSLAEQDGRLLTKETLFSSVWDGTIVSESALTSVIKELRRALGDESRTPRFIESVYGRGYRLIPPVQFGGNPGLRAVQPPARDGATGEDRPVLVLVSAFEDEAVRARFPHCAAQLREEVLSGLARFREIHLVADDRGEQQAGDGQLRASDRDYLLTATLLPDGEGIKVVARAKRLVDRRIVWAETMALADIGTAGGVEKIVRRIVGAALPAVDEDVLDGLPHESDDLYDRYLIAKRRSLTARTYDEAQAAARELERIVAARPDFALAYPPLVRLYNTDFGYTSLGSTGPDERDRALALAKAGLAADRGNVHAYTVLGFCHLWHGEHDLARGYFERALLLNPYNHVRLQEVAAGWMYIGDLAGAGALMERAGELNHVPDDNFYEDFGRLRLIAGDYRAAHAMLDAILSGTIWAELYLALSELGLGIPGGVDRFDGWCARVEANWRSSRPLTSAELARWIRHHHPLPDDAGQRFFADVGAALDRRGLEDRPEAHR